MKNFIITVRLNKAQGHPLINQPPSGTLAQAYVYADNIDVAREMLNKFCANEHFFVSEEESIAELINAETNTAFFVRANVENSKKFGCSLSTFTRSIS